MCALLVSVLLLRSVLTSPLQAGYFIPACQECMCCRVSPSGVVCSQGSYATLGMATSTTHWRNLAVVAVIALVALTVNNTTKKINATKTERKRTAALKELEKEQ